MLAQEWNQDPPALASVFSTVGPCRLLPRWPEEQMLRLPRVRAAKVLAQDQLEGVGGSWSSSISSPFLPSPRRDRSPAPSCPVAFTLAWCSEKVMPFFWVSLSAKTGP